MGVQVENIELFDSAGGCTAFSNWRSGHCCRCCCCMRS